MPHRWFKIGLIVFLILILGAAIWLGAQMFRSKNTPEGRTLASLKKVDDFPLYVMHYYADYAFDEFLQTGYQAAAPTVGVGFACSCFAAQTPDGDRIFGRNFDWMHRPTLVLFTHPDGAYDSVSIVDIDYLGFTEYGPGLGARDNLLDAPMWPFDGMNEKGLVVGMMAVDHARDDGEPGQATIGTLHAIRLMLDYAATVDEAVDLLGQYRIDLGNGPPVHYLVSDVGGASAIIEWVDGEMIVLPGESAWQVCTNFILSQVRPEGAHSPCRRYNKAYTTLLESSGQLTEAEAMALLAEVSQNNTIWSAVFNQTSGDIRVAVGRRYERVHEFHLDMAKE
ncbi:MAG: linear amide C-N hydrolase [Anaerolineae bacterium]|nr:linear amide C-N hydrolase [Anaerolineae bacterium]